MASKQIKTRFAPSPTGRMHIGSVRASLLPYIFARKNNGIFLLRFDDTDKERSKKEYEEDILNNLKWLEIEYDETFRQSLRNQVYDAYFEILKEKNLIYECFDSPDELEEIKIMKRLQKKAPIITKQDCKYFSNRSGYWRFDLQKTAFEFNDIIQGTLKFGRDWSDPVIKKTNGEYTYILTSVIDDIESNVTHIIRGEDHIANTATQKTIGDAICNIKFKQDWDIQFAHFSFFLDSSGAKVSKRKLDNDLLSLKHLESMTFWSVMTSLGTSQNQIFSMDKNDYIQYFDLNKFSKAKQKFSYEILEQTNKKLFHLKAKPNQYSESEWNLLKDNATDTEHMNEMIENLNNFIKSDSELKRSIMSNQNPEDVLNHMKITSENTFKIYQEILNQEYGPKLLDLFNYIKKFNS